MPAFPLRRMLRAWVRILVLGLAALLPLAPFAWTAWRERAEVLAEGTHSATRTAWMLREQVAGVLERHEMLLSEAVRLVEGRSWEEVARDSRLFDRITHIAAEIGATRVAIADAEGRLRLTTDRHPAPVTASLREEEAFMALRLATSGATHIGRARGAQHERVLPLARRILSPDGRFDGMVLAEVPITAFTSFWARVAPGLPHIVPLVRTDGAVIARYPAPTTPEWLNANGSFMSHALARRDGVFTATSQVDRIERLTAFTRVREYPLHIGFGIETSALLAEWRARVWLLAAYGFGAAIALVAAVALVLRQRRRRAAEAERWREITARLEAETAAREQAEAALRRALTLDAMGQLTAGVAHDFNNLLQAIRSGLFLLSPHVPDRSRQVLEMSLQAVDRGARLVKQLMVLARREQLEPCPVDLVALVAGMGELLQKAVGPQVRIEVEFDRRVDPVRVDPTQTELAILNLAVNARDAMPEGGTLAITARNVTVLHSDPVRQLAPGDYVLLQLSDSGCGMPPDVLEHALEPFFTTKPVGKGTGLGLSMVQSFVAQSGGTMRIDSAPGRGTVVSLHLPRSAAAPAAKPEEAPAPTQGAAGRCLLLVDDDALGRLATAAALRHLGHTVHEARDAEEALLALRREPAIEMLVTDYAMPGMNGGALAKAARAIRPNLPVVIVTGYAAATLEDAQPDIVAVLRKPCRVEDLDALVRRTLASPRPPLVLGFPQGERRAG